MWSRVKPSHKTSLSSAGFHTSQSHHLNPWNNIFGLLLQYVFVDAGGFWTACWSPTPGEALSAWTWSLSRSSSKVLCQTGSKFCEFFLCWSWLTSVDRQFGFGQHEEPFPSSLISGPPPTLWILLPGRCPSHPRSSALRQSFCHRRFHTRRRGLPPKRRETEELSPAASSLRPPAPLDAPGEEISSSQASGEPSPSLQLPLPPWSRWSFRPLLPLPLQPPPELPTHFPAPQTSRGHLRLSAAPVSMAANRQPLPLTAGPHSQAEQASKTCSCKGEMRLWEGFFFIYMYI